MAKHQIQRIQRIQICPIHNLVGKSIKIKLNTRRTNYLSKMVRYYNLIIETNLAPYYQGAFCVQLKETLQFILAWQLIHLSHLKRVIQSKRHLAVHMSVFIPTTKHCWLNRIWMEKKLSLLFETRCSSVINLNIVNEMWHLVRGCNI